MRTNRQRTATGRRKPRHVEHDHQVALFRWAAAAEHAFPELSRMHAVPNGGQRNILTAARIKAEGARAGVWDIFLPVARAGYHGMYIEMKAGKNKLTEAQEWFRVGCARQGYHMSGPHYDWERAATAIEAYLRAKQHYDESTWRYIRGKRPYDTG